MALFDKDKSYSPKAIDGMATGGSAPSKWLVACAIVILLDEKPKILKSILTDDDLFMLFAKPLLDNDKKAILSELIAKYKLAFLKNRLNE